MTTEIDKDVALLLKRLRGAKREFDSIERKAKKALDRASERPGTNLAGYKRKAGRARNALKHL